jgi:hypothetical protein
MKKISIGLLSIIAITTTVAWADAGNSRDPGYSPAPIPSGNPSGNSSGNPSVSPSPSPWGPASACLPLDQPIPFTISHDSVSNSDAYDDTNYFAGGPINLNVLDPADPIALALESSGIPATATLGRVDLNSTPASTNAQTTFRNSQNSTVILQIDAAQGGDSAATIHGVLKLNVPDLVQIVQSFQGYTINPTTHAVVPQLHEFCVNSLALVGQFNKGTSTFNGHIFLIMSKGGVQDRIELDARNVSQRKNSVAAHSQNGDVQMAEWIGSSAAM